MAQNNLTAVLYGINDIRIENWPVDEPADGEVLLKMGCVGICGSDVHYLVHGRIDKFIVKEPMIIGHESAGTVVKVGKKVTNLKVGDRVAIEPGVPCRMCKFCKEGDYHLCKDIQFLATPPVHGSLRHYHKHAADFCFKLPDHVSLEEGALLEPLSVGVHACKKGDVNFTSKVLILGAGPIGLVTLLVAHAMSSSKIVITDLVQTRLDLAKKLAPCETVLIEPGMTVEKTVEKVVTAFGCQPTVVVDASGAESSIKVALDAVANGGTIVLVGMGKPEITIPLISAIPKEITIKGSFRYCSDYAGALDLVATKKIDITPLVTHNLMIEETIKAFDIAKDTSSGAVKIMIHVHK